MTFTPTPVKHHASTSGAGHLTATALTDLLITVPADAAIEMSTYTDDRHMFDRAPERWTVTATWQRPLDPSAG